jgi:hypothetical protein
MCRFLLRGASLCWFDPAYQGNSVGFDVVGLEDFVAMGLVFWVNRNGDVERNHCVGVKDFLVEWG